MRKENEAHTTKLRLYFVVSISAQKKIMCEDEIQAKTCDYNLGVFASYSRRFAN